MYAEVPEVHLPLGIVERPARIGDGCRLMSRVGAHGGVAGVDGRACLVVDLVDKSTAAAHHELAVPVVRQQQGELDLLADHARDAAVRDTDGARRRRRDGNGFRHLHVGQLQRRELQAFGVIGRDPFDGNLEPLARFWLNDFDLGIPLMDLFLEPVA